MKNKFANLKPSALDSYSDTANLVPEVEKEIGMALPEELTALLIEIGDAVVFDKGVKFKPTTPTGREDPHGYLDLNLLYGLQVNDHGLMECSNALQDQFPTNLVPKGEALGGDQICLDRTSSRVLYWKHDAEEEIAVTEIAANFSDFISLLEINIESPEEKSDLRAKRTVIKEKSHLDF